MATRTQGLVILICATVLLLALIQLSGGAPEASSERQPGPVEEAIIDQARVAVPPKKEQTKPGSVDRVAISNQTVVRGRCVAAESGRPLIGCHVSLQRHSARDGGAEQSSGPGNSVESVASDGEGRFAFTFASLADHAFRVMITATNRVSRTGIFDLKPRTTLDFGDIDLLMGSRVHARVIDTEGRPVAGARVLLDGRRQPRPVGEDALQEHWSNHADSQIDGSVEFKYPVPRGTWNIRLEDAPSLVEPRQILIGANEPDKRFDILVRTFELSDILTGSVVDEAGQPVAGASVSAADPWPTGDSANVKEDGSFVLYRSVELDKNLPVKLSVHASAGHESLQTTESYKWGTTDIRLTLRRFPGLPIQIVEADTLKPIERFSVKCCLLSGWSQFTNRKRFAGEHAGGHLTIPGVSTGKNMLIVYPQGEKYLPSIPIVFDMPSGTSGLMRVELRPATHYQVQVVDNDGNPVSGTNIELLKDLTGNGVHKYTFVCDLDTLFERGSGSEMAVRLATASTNEQGWGTLKWRASASELTVRVLGPGHIPLQRDGVILLEDSPPIRIVVARGARLHGSIRPVSSLHHLIKMPAKHQPGEPGLVVREAVGTGNKRFPESRGSFFPIGPDGSFSIDGIPPGTWQIVLFKWKMSLRGTGRTPFYYDPPLATVTVTDGQTEKLDFDIVGKFDSGRLSGIVYENSEPLPNTELCFEYGRRDGKAGVRVEGLQSGFKTDAQGRFSVGPLEPAYYQITVRLGGGGQMATLPGMRWRELQPGQHLEQQIHVVTTRARIRVLDADGTTPATNRRFFLFNREAQSSISAVTNDEGVLRLDHAPAGQFEIVTWPENWAQLQSELPWQEQESKKIKLGSITVPRGGKEASFELRMPRQSK